MTRGSIREYTEVVQGQYLWTMKKEKSKTLDKFTKVIGSHHESAIRLLCRGNQPKANNRISRQILFLRSKLAQIIKRREKGCQPQPRSTDIPNGDFSLPAIPSRTVTDSFIPASLTFFPISIQF